MKNKRKSYSIALASIALIIFLILVSSVASAYSVQSSSPTITDSQITNNRSASSPAIYSDRVVYQDSNNGSSDIYMYDLFTSDKTQITTSGSVWGHPVINGDRIVWTDSRNGKDEVYMYDLFTSNKTQITTNGSAYNPAIYGDRIVWENRSNENSDIYMYDLLTSKKTQITNSGSYELAYNPDIYGEKIVWQNYLNGNWDIYMYDLLTEKETRVTTNGSATGPAIYGDRIVWIDSRNGTTDIYMYDLFTKKETRITTSGLAYNPAIYGGKVVYEDSRSGNPDIYMYDLFTMKETRITTSGSAYSPVIDGYRIVYQDYRNGNSDIYMGTIPGKELKTPEVNFSSDVTEGYVPLSVQFTDLSENATEWNWEFGDGVNSTEQNSAHIYSSAGTYIVNLTATDGKGTDSKLATITVLDVIPVASLSTNVTEGYAPLSVQFTDLSENTVSRSWEFGDGTTSTEQNPTHTYNETGQYTVTLTAKNMLGSNAITKYNFINIANGVLPVVSFSSNVTEGYAPLSVQFTDQSQNAAQWDWEFGDGTNSTEQNPTHAYNETGQYTVTLTAKNMLGGNAITKYSYINVANA
jgi:beta propeller repeat protein